jgi:hypothetical protein
LGSHRENTDPAQRPDHRDPTEDVMQNNTAGRKRTARGITALAVAGMAAGSILVGAVPAHAATLQQALFSDRVEFLGNENNSDVSGAVKLTIQPDGAWNIYSNTRNGRPAFRHVHWTCVVTVKDASSTSSTTISTPVVKIKRKKSHTFDVSGTSTNFATNYEAIIDPQATSVACDIHFGK